MSARLTRMFNRSKATEPTAEPTAEAEPPTVPMRVPPARTSVDDVTVAERAVLIRTCIYVRDRVTSTALAQRLDQALADVGVSLLNPVGQRFDASQHEAGGTEPTGDQSLVGTVAIVEVPGYADRGVLLRAPVVTVYQSAPGGSTRPGSATRRRT